MGRSRRRSSALAHQLRLELDRRVTRALRSTAHCARRPLRLRPEAARRL